MRVLVTDLVCQGLEIQLELPDWIAILRKLSATSIVDPETLHRWEGGTCIYVPRDVARRIGARLEQMFFDDVRASTKPLVIPDYIRPIATSNGLWIDPALPLLKRPEQDSFHLRFAGFCRICEGFSIS